MYLCLFTFIVVCFGLNPAAASNEHTTASPSLYLSFDIFGDKLIIKVYLTNDFQSYYRSQIDSKKTELIGQFVSPPNSGE